MTDDESPGEYTPYELPRQEPRTEVPSRTAPHPPATDSTAEWLAKWGGSIEEHLAELEALREIATNFHGDPLYQARTRALQALMTRLVDRIAGQSPEGAPIARIWHLLHL